MKRTTSWKRHGNHLEIIIRVNQKENGAVLERELKRAISKWKRSLDMGISYDIFTIGDRNNYPDQDEIKVNGTLKADYVGSGTVLESEEMREEKTVIESMTVKEKMVHLMDTLINVVDRIAEDENAKPEKLALLPALTEKIVNITGYAVIDEKSKLSHL